MIAASVGTWERSCVFFVDAGLEALRCQDYIKTNYRSKGPAHCPQRRIQAMEMSCYRNILRISYKHHVTDEDVCAKIQQAIGPHEDFKAIVKRCNL